MKRWHTEVFEATSGFLLFAVAFAVLRMPSALPASYADWRTPIAIIAIALGCASFMAHLIWERPQWRMSILAIVGMACLAVAYWHVRFGALEVAALYGLYGATMFFAAALEVRTQAPDASPLISRFVMLLLLAYVVIAIMQAMLGAAGSWWLDLQFLGIAPAVAAGLAALGAAMLAWCEWHLANKRASDAVGITVAILLAMMGTGRLISGTAIEGGISLIVLAVALIVARVYPGFQLCVPPEADAAALAEERSLYQHQHIVELGIWTIAAAAGLYACLSPSTDFNLFFAGLFLTGIITHMSNHLGRATSRWRHFLTLAAFMLTFIPIMHATGGFRSPLVLFAFVGMISMTTIAKSSRFLVVFGVFAGYLTMDFADQVAHGTIRPGDISHYVFLILALALVGVYGTVVGRRRDAYEADIERINRELKIALETSTRERERYEAQAGGQHGLNKELLEMRSALINVLEDVEESKRQIERDFRRDTAIFAGIGEAVVAADMDRKIFLFNLAAVAVTGTPVDKAIGAPFDTIIRFMHEDSSVLETGAGTRAFEGMAASLPPKMEALKSDGRRIPVTGTATPFFDEQNHQQGVVLAFRDVTAEREVDRQKSSFVSIASHQLRTPLSAIRWYLDLLLAGDAGRLSKQAHEFLTDIYTSATRMNNLVDDLLNVNRIETGRIVLKPAETDLREMLESIAKDFVGLLSKRKLTMEQKLAENIPHITIDASTVRQAITNLVSNAVNYTPEGGRITLRLSVDGKKLLVAITDTGIGIPKVAQHRLFERFFRAENAVSRETVGSGMGLFITKLLIETNHGTVWFESVEGKGTTFFVAFPLTLAGPQPTIK